MEQQQQINEFMNSPNFALAFAGSKQQQPEEGHGQGQDCGGQGKTAGLTDKLTVGAAHQ